MFKRWWLIHYLATYKEEESSRDLFNDIRVKRFDLVLYCVFTKRFREDWRFTITRWFCWIKKGSVPSTKFYSQLSDAQFKEIEDIIDLCLSDHLIQIHQSQSSSSVMKDDAILWADHKSREFLSPLVFFTAISEKYGPLKTGFIGAIIAGIIGLIAYIYKP